jgi:hypothetical protein
VAVGCGAVVRRRAARLRRAGRPGAEGAGARCFYDDDEQIELWGKFLAEELPAIYGEQAAAVTFVSAEYAAREWTRVERRTALARAVRERREYVLPARFDGTSLPGLPSDMVTVVPGVSDEILPEYVLRDVDAAESGIRAKVTAAAEQGGFVLLAGGPQSGRPVAQ